MGLNRARGVMERPGQSRQISFLLYPEIPDAGSEVIKGALDAQAPLLEDMSVDHGG